ncbi:tetratricopeptide repeat protein [Streptosporangiaceae bacterium NEAU-GS5]|nr:tetratricopeptide repeat protein [Streptosporangiaceae bacterium NEAU-GS5]
MSAVRHLEAAVKQAWSGADWLPHLRELTELIAETERRSAGGDRVAQLAARACKALIPYGEIGTARELAESALRLRRVSRWSRLPLRYHRARAMLEQGEIEAARAELAAVLDECRSDLGTGHHLTTAVESARFAFDGDPALEERFYRIVLAERLAAHGSDDSRTLETRFGLINALNSLNRHAEAEEECRAILADHHRLGGSDPAAAQARGVLGTVLHRAGRYDEAERELRAATDHADPRLLPSALHALALLFLDLDRPKSAEAALRGALPSSERLSGRKAPDTYEIRVTLAWALIEQGRGDEVVEELRELVRILTAYSPRGHWALLARLGLAKSTNDVAEMRSIAEAYVQIFGPDDRETLDAHYELGLALGHSEEAGSILRSVFEARIRLLPPGHPATTKAQTALEHATRP